MEASNVLIVVQDEKELIEDMYPDHGYIQEINGVSKQHHTANIRLKCRTKQEFQDWLKEHEARSGVTFRVQTVKPRTGKSVIYKAVYRCHRNTQPSSHKNRVKNPSKRHTGCEAKLNVTIKSSTENRRVRSQDMLRDEFPTVMTVYHRHNHSIDGVEVAKFKDPSEEVKKKFLDLFKSGHLPPKALKLHKHDLQLEHGDNYFKVVADRSVCPDQQWAYRLYYSYLKREFGRCCESICKHKKKLPNLEWFGNVKDLENNTDAGNCSCSMGNEVAPYEHQSFIANRCQSPCLNTVSITSS